MGSLKDVDGKLTKIPPTILGIGSVNGNYIYKGTESEYYHTYKVLWSDHEEIPVPSPLPKGRGKVHPQARWASASAATTRFTLAPIPEIDIPNIYQSLGIKI